MTFYRWAVLLTLLVGVGGVARAEDAAEYGRHYQRARDAVKANDLRTAATEFEAADAASPNTDAVFDLGVVYRHLAAQSGKREDARAGIEAFERYLSRYRVIQGGDPPDVKSLERWLEELRKRAAGELPPQPPESAPVVQQVVPPSPPPQPVEPAQPPQLHSAGPPPPWSPPTVSLDGVALPEQAAASAGGVPGTSAVGEAGGSGPSGGAAALMALGVAGLITSAIAAGFGAAENSTIRNGGVANLAALQSDFSQGQTWNTLAVVGAVAGGLAGGLGLLLWVTSPSHAPVAVMLSPAPGGAFATFSMGLP